MVFLQYELGKNACLNDVYRLYPRYFEPSMLINLDQTPVRSFPFFLLIFFVVQSTSCLFFT